MMQRRRSMNRRGAESESQGVVAPSRQEEQSTETQVLSTAVSWSLSISVTPNSR